MPNDHVDVILTHSGPEGQTSETLLSNVRVLAINTRLGETGTTGAPADSNQASGDGDPKSQVFANTAIATLELDPVQAETIVNATSLGRLSLALNDGKTEIAVVGRNLLDRDYFANAINLTDSVGTTLRYYAPGRGLSLELRRLF